MAENLTIITEYVTPGGVCLSPRKGGHILCRVALGHIEADDGVIREMEDGTGPIAWETEAARKEALEAIAARTNLAGDLSARLIAHIKRTPFYQEVAK